MFNKILIANRGEIACRVIRTARRMGIQTVAVYSEADRDALHTTMADEAICIGPPAAAESYLVIDNIVQACRETGAEAVHPGYGFLSENPVFAERLAEAGIVFIGPGVRAIRSMGDKITSKRLAKEAGVHTIPGHPEAIESPEQAVVIAQKVGYPVMLKASAGGWRQGDAHGAQRQRVPRRVSASNQRSAGRLWRRSCLPREVHPRAAPCRDPGAGRPAWPCHLSGGARMLDPTPPSESD